MLLSVVLALAVVGMLAFTMNREAGQAPALARAQLEAEEARYLVETALNHAAWEANDGTCAGYGLPTTPFGGQGHTYSATFTPNSGSPVQITATGTTAGGATRTRTREKVTVIEAPSTMALQPDAGAGKDTWLYQWKPTWNHGTDVKLTVARWTGSDARALLSFDVSAIPPAAQITSAVLELNHTYSGTPGGPIEVRRVTSDWTEGSASGGVGQPNWTARTASTNWTVPGGDFAATVYATKTIPSGGTGWFAWDLTALVQEWVGAVQPNRGLALVAIGGAQRWFEFHSSDSATAALRPKLTVTYACECGTGGGSGTITLKPSGWVARDTYIDDNNPGTNWGAEERIRLTSKSNSRKRGLLRFDLSEFNPAVNVGAATLEMNLEGIGSGGTGTVTAHRVTRAWTENAATWTNANAGTPWTAAGGDYDPSAVASAAIDALAPGARQWDLTSLAAGWVSGATTNDGVLLLASNDVNHADFTTSDAPNAAQHPKLTISFSCGCAVPSASSSVTLQPDGAAGLDTRITSTQPSTNFATFAAIIVKNYGGSIDRGLLRFDLSAIPSSALISSATLELEAANMTFPGNVTAHRATRTWDEATATWNNAQAATPWSTAGGDFVAAAADTRWIAALGKTGFDVTTIVSEWVQGGQPNHGILLKGDPGVEVSFSSSDNPSLSERPKLTVNFVCPCGIGCTAAQVPKLLMVVVNPASLTAGEQATRTLIESWGYVVTLIDDDASQAAFNTAAAANDVAFIGEDVTASAVGTKLVAAPIGVVYDEDNLSDEFGVAASIHWGSGTSLTIAESTHYIIEPFVPGPLTVLTVSEPLADLTGARSPDLAILGSAAAGPALVALNAGARTYAGGTTAGRRVQLPWGGDAHDVTKLTAGGLTLFQRALAWAAGTGPSWVPPPEYLDEFSARNCTAADYTGSNGSLDWSPKSWTEIGDSGNSCSGTVQLKPEGSNFAILISAAGAGLRRDVDLSPFTTAYLNIKYRRVDWDGAGEALLVEVWDTVSSAWVEIGRVSGVGTDAAFREASFALTSHISANASLRFTALGLDGSGAGADLVYLDRIHVVEIPREGFYYLDQFAARNCNASDLAGSDGTLDWSVFSWAERGESNGSCAGLTQIGTDPVLPESGSYRLVLQGKDAGASREVDLSAFTSAWLSFDYRRFNYPTMSDFFKVEVDDGVGSGWVTLDTFTGIASDPGYLSVSYDISAYAAATTRIRFETGGINTIQTAFVDNVKIHETVSSSGPAKFGFESIFDSTQNNVRRKQIATRVTLPVNGTITSISAYVGGRDRDVRYAVYSDAGGEPGALLVESANVVTPIAMSWVTIDVPATALAAGNYWLALSFDDSAQEYRYQNGGQTRYNNNRATTLGYSATWGASSATYTRNISIYGTYTPAN